jgi:hypothetical protein
MRILVAVLLAVSLLTLANTSAFSWECDVKVSGPSTVKLDQPITLSAIGTPTGGSYSWSRTPNLIPSGSTATLTGFTPTYSDYIKVIGYYTSPKGKKCSDTKWLWACVCTVTNLKGPDEAKIGEQVTLTAQADPAGGTYTWTVNSGTGTISASDSSAVFVGDKAGPVEIKVSYVPPDGGKPCVKFHKIEVGNDCSVSLSGDMYQRPVCRPVNFYAQGQPNPGVCSWSPSADFTKDGCNAIYDGTSPGYYTVTATYTRPGGTTCEDSKSILSYELVDNMTPKKVCFISGSNIEVADFNLTTSPPGFHNNAVFSPSSVSTLLHKKQDILVSASLVCETNPNTVSTVITVVNENKTTGFGLEVEIPNLIKEPLKFLGIAEQFDFKLKNSYEQGAKCCTDGAKDYTKGSTSVDASIDLGKTIYGMPMPQKWKKYLTLAALKVDLKGESKVAINGEYKACENLEKWDGGGLLGVKLDAGSEVKVNLPYVLLEGEVKGTTDINETLTVGSSKITVDGQWGGLAIKGNVKILLLDWTIKPIEISHQIFDGDKTPVFTIDLPSL